MVNNKRQSATEKRAKKKEIDGKFKAANIQHGNKKAIAKEKEAEIPAIAKEDTAKAAQLEKGQEELTQFKLDAHQGKDGKEKAITKEEEAKAAVIATEAAAEGAQMAKGQEKEVNSN